LNVIDENFKKLGINMEYLEPSTDKVKVIKEFVKNTHCDTHKYYDLEVQDVFELQKE
jgi:poly [ADP-ribose] polymerase